MSGRGKGAKGLGKGGAKRHRKVLRDNIQGVTKPAIRRLARRGGVKRISGLIYEETRGVLKVFLESVLRDAVTYTEHGRRKTVTAMDVVYALKRQGRTLYGFDQGGYAQGVGTTRRRRRKQPPEGVGDQQTPTRPPSGGAGGDPDRDLKIEYEKHIKQQKIKIIPGDFKNSQSAYESIYSYVENVIKKALDEKCDLRKVPPGIQVKAQEINFPNKDEEKFIKNRFRDFVETKTLAKYEIKPTSKSFLFFDLIGFTSATLEHGTIQKIEVVKLIYKNKDVKVYLIQCYFNNGTLVKNYAMKVKLLSNKNKAEIETQMMMKAHVMFPNITLPFITHKICKADNGRYYVVSIQKFANVKKNKKANVQNTKKLSMTKQLQEQWVIKMIQLMCIGCFHLDNKPGNIVVDTVNGKETLYLIDLDLSRCWEKHKKHQLYVPHAFAALVATAMIYVSKAFKNSQKHKKGAKYWSDVGKDGIMYKMMEIFSSSNQNIATLNASLSISSYIMHTDIGHYAKPYIIGSMIEKCFDQDDVMKKQFKGYKGDKTIHYIFSELFPTNDNFSRRIDPPWWLEKLKLIALKELISTFFHFCVSGNKPIYKNPSQHWKSSVKATMTYYQKQYDQNQNNIES